MMAREGRRGQSDRLYCYCMVFIALGELETIRRRPRALIVHDHPVVVLAGEYTKELRWWRSGGNKGRLIKLPLTVYHCVGIS